MRRQVLLTEKDVLRSRVERSQVPSCRASSNCSPVPSSGCCCWWSHVSWFIPGCYARHLGWHWVAFALPCFGGICLMWGSNGKTITKALRQQFGAWNAGGLGAKAAGLLGWVTLAPLNSIMSLIPCNCHGPWVMIPALQLLSRCLWRPRLCRARWTWR